MIYVDLHKYKFYIALQYINTHWSCFLNFKSLQANHLLRFVLLFCQPLSPPPYSKMDFFSPNAYNRVLQIAEYSEILQIKSWIMKKKGGLYYLLTILIFNLWIASIALFVCLFLVVCFTETGLTVLMEIYRLKLKVALISPIITF